MFCHVDGRDYFRCGQCAVRWLSRAQLPSPAEEAAHYRHHRNAVDDPGYRAFLGRLATPLMAKLAAGSSGLDFGCGPGPALAAMLREAGHPMRLYDPIFATDPAPLSQRYDFVTCTEVVEHFHDARAHFATLFGLVRPGGWLGIITCFQSDDARFAQWHYRRDPTHVIFYREASLRWLAEQAGFCAWRVGKDVMLMQRLPADARAGNAMVDNLTAGQIGADAPNAGHQSFDGA